MAKKAVATFAAKAGARSIVKCIRMDKSPKTGAYVFVEQFVDAGKEKDFFRIIDNLDKQIIIVTKSFLTEVGPNNYVLDKQLLDELKIKGSIYRIEKKRPFDDKNQATIQTVITRIR